jgi:GntR family transcriptional regulator / MocR family aminotransferase
MTGPTELLVALDRASSLPLRVQMEQQLREAIRSGRLRAGDRVPASRTLATDLGVSRGLVQECYLQLQAEGYLTSQVGSATRVAETATTTRATPPPAVVARDRPRLIADFESGVPDLGSVPRTDWAWAVREVCRTAPNGAFDYGDARGAAELRQVLSAYLRRVRAVDAGADQVVVCVGMAQALAVVLRAAAPTVVAVEDPGSFGTVTAAVSPARCEVVPVPVDERGLDVAALARTPARAVVVTPAHQWPTGVVLAPERRHALIAWARDHDALIVEDDYDAEFRYDREPVGTLQGLAPDRVAALGTVSKSLAPALRLGWAVVPGRLVEAVTAVKRAADRGTAGIDQLALALLIESGRYDRHLRRMRGEYAARRDALVTALAGCAPDLRVTGLAAGFHAVVELPAGTDVAGLVERARQRGVGLYPMSRYRSDGRAEPPQLIFGFGNVGVRAIRAGIEAIGDLLGGS